MIRIYHNPRCRKSRETLQLIRDKAKEVKVIEYLKEMPDRATLERILELLKLSPAEVIRKGETLYKQKYKGKEFSRDQWLDILLENPVLLERPIVVNGDKAVVGRPPENVLEIL